MDNDTKTLLTDLAQTLADLSELTADLNERTIGRVDKQFVGPMRDKADAIQKRARTLLERLQNIP